LHFVNSTEGSRKGVELVSCSLCTDHFFLKKQDQDIELYDFSPDGNGGRSSLARAVLAEEGHRAHLKRLRAGNELRVIADRRGCAETDPC
jgi:hypothetical protein